MLQHYTAERSVQIVIALLKAHGIKRVIASPGATNVTFVASIQQDPFFEIYSAPDERSAAYMACGIAEESNEPVVLTCTGATSSRNYMPGLTEAYYRHLPILAITAVLHWGKIGNLTPQAMDRTQAPHDVVKFSVQIPLAHTPADEWACNVKVNEAILELFHHGGGPVHINLMTDYSRDFSVKVLPEERKISRYCLNNNLPEIPVGSKVGIFVGAHVKWSKELLAATDRFCERNNAVVFCDHSSNYYGKYRVDFALAGVQDGGYEAYVPDILIHIGMISGDYYTIKICGRNTKTL